LASWIREVVQSNSELVPALERLRRSYRVLQAGKPVTQSGSVTLTTSIAMMNYNALQATLR
jgi:hypothetical protein